jgi:hypothetical protein
MPIFGELATGKRRSFPWRSWLVCLAILALDVHLANRFHLPLCGAATVQANSAKVQHIDRDAYRWAPPVVTLSVPLLPAPAPPVVADERGYLSPHVHCLYDRPPPALA